MGVRHHPTLFKMTQAQDSKLIADFLPRLVSNLDDQKSALASLAAQQVETATALKSVAEDVKAVSNAHLELAKEVSDSHRAPYNLWLTGVGLVFMIIGGATWYLSDQIQKSETITNVKITNVEANLDERLQRRLEDRRREFDKQEADTKEAVSKLDDRLREVEKRTYTLYKSGQPY